MPILKGEKQKFCRNLYCADPMDINRNLAYMMKASCSFAYLRKTLKRALNYLCQNDRKSQIANNVIMKEIYRSCETFFVTLLSDLKKGVNCTQEDLRQAYKQTFDNELNRWPEPKLQINDNNLLTLLDETSVSEVELEDPYMDDFKTDSDIVTREQDVDEPIENTRLLKMYSDIDPRVRELGFVMKNLAKLNDGLSTNVPNVRKCGNWNVYFYDNLNNINQVWKGYGLNKLSSGELWIEFLRYYTERFDYETNIVTIRQDKPLLRLEKGWFHPTIAIEDPFCLTHNLTDKLSLKRTVAGLLINTSDFFVKELFDFPTVKINISSDTGFGLICVRLCMIVEKTSSSILLSSGILNVTHYKSHEHPEQLNIKEIYNIEITLSGVCIYLPSSCRLCLSLSTSDWPIV
ncbi:unnamed protein product [Rotaria sp. Silwood2]|nr:unnamed protein product [Rotaria sp. Silwood2]